MEKKEVLPLVVVVNLYAVLKNRERRSLLYTFAVVACFSFCLGCVQDNLIIMEFIMQNQSFRTDYDLSHYDAVCGQIGRLQTLSVIPVIAGDSMSINLSGSMRLSPLRRALTLDSKVDLYAFFVPHRHVYGDAWTNMLLEGQQSSVVLPTVAPQYNDPIRYIPCGARKHTTPNLPLFYSAGYSQIWNQYFRVPNVTVDESDWLPEDEFLPTGDSRDYGHVVARLPTFTSGCVLDKTDPSLADVEVDSDSINLIDIASAKSLYKSQVDRDWFGRRYRDMLQNSFGSKGQVNIDADQRPELLMHESNWMSGYDIDGTDDATLGQYSGKSQAMIKLNMPNKYFKEHGSLWIMAVVRFPAIYNNSEHFISLNCNKPSYSLMSGDPLLARNTPPQMMNRSDFFSELLEKDLGYQPSYNYFRTHVNYIHDKFKVIPGFPFIDPVRTNDLNDAVYEDPKQYDMFQSEELAHWNLIAKVQVNAKRVLPSASSSLNAGLN